MILKSNKIMDKIFQCIYNKDINLIFFLKLLIIFFKTIDEDHP